MRAPRSSWLVGALCACAACASQSHPAPPPAPVVDEPALLVPPDLDLVVRLDLARLRPVLGIEGNSLLERVERAAPTEEPDGDTARTLLGLFTHAETAWIGVRPGLAPELTDSVVVLRGDFRGLMPNELGGSPRWQHALDLGGDVRRFERTAPKLRAAPAVLYTRGLDLVVVGSTAEIDALERSIDDGQGGPPLRAPEAGLVAVAARLGLLRARLADKAPTLARLLDGAETLSATLDRENTGFGLRMELAFDIDDRTDSVAAALKALAEALRAPGREWLGQVKIEPLGRTLALSLALSDAELEHALHCARAEGC